MASLDEMEAALRAQYDAVTGVSPERLAQAKARDFAPFKLARDVFATLRISPERALTVARAIHTYGSVSKAADFANQDGLYQHHGDLLAWEAALAVAPLHLRPALSVGSAVDQTVGIAA